MDQTITVIKGCVIKNNKILLVLRDEKNFAEAHLRWELPGGRLEFGEDPVETVKREFKEEVGCDIRVIGLIPQLYSCVWDYKTHKQFTLVLGYHCETDDVPQITGDHKIKQIGWFTREEMNTLSLLPATTEFIDAVISTHASNTAR